MAALVTPLCMQAILTNVQIYRGARQDAGVCVLDGIVGSIVGADDTQMPQLVLKNAETGGQSL